MWRWFCFGPFCSEDPTNPGVWLCLFIWSVIWWSGVRRNLGGGR